MSSFTEQFKKVYQQVKPGTHVDFEAIYTQDAIIDDPLKTIEGIDFYQDYFNQKINSLSLFNILFLDEIAQEHFDYHHTFLRWQLQLSDAALHNGKIINLEGASFLKIRDKVFYQKNYYDLGSLLYENTPLLGHLVRKLKEYAADFEP